MLLCPLNQFEFTASVSFRVSYLICFQICQCFLKILGLHQSCLQLGNLNENRYYNHLLEM